MSAVDGELFVAAFKNSICHNALHHIIFPIGCTLNYTLSSFCLSWWRGKMDQSVLRSATHKMFKKSWASFSTKGKHSTCEDFTKTGKRERGTGSRERESRNECTAATRPRTQNGKKKEKKRAQSGEIWGSITVVNVSFYRMCPQMTNTFLIEQSLLVLAWTKHEMAPVEKSRKIYDSTSKECSTRNILQWCQWA